MSTSIIAPIYVNSAIFTDFGLNTLNSILAGNTNTIIFNNVKIGDGNGNTVVLDPLVTKMVHPVYVLPVQSVVLGSDITTVTATIPSTVQNFTIREIGLFVSSPEGDKLFATSSVLIDIPLGLEFKLILEINYNLSVVNIPSNLISIAMNPETYITPYELDTFSDTILPAVSTNINNIILNDYSELTGNIISYTDFDSISDFDSTPDIDNAFNIFPDPNPTQNTIIDGVFTQFNSYKYNVTNLSNIDSACKLNSFLNSVGTVVEEDYSVTLDVSTDNVSSSAVVPINAIITSVSTTINTIYENSTATVVENIGTGIYEIIQLTNGCDPCSRE